MKYVFVKDAEGFVSKKAQHEILADDKIISEKEYLKKSGLEFYEKKFNHGGARQGAGRKRKFARPLEFQIRVTQEEKDFIQNARLHGFDFSRITFQNS